ncbi:MAG: ABC transporter ATP-binding protein [Rhodospirillaceae bacterium]|nr:ABC transporter ATP-binding protein [Rhodospirillaceae bacterium]|tara:strand:+ start:10813 stop:11580 length:768 start_codon:yes stop_codon:yes gene_type:complete
MTNPIIKLSNITKTFGDKTILNNLDLQVNKGESLVIIGGSGTGKSVTLKCILGLLKIDSGSINIFDRDIEKSSINEKQEILKKIGMLFQGSALFDSLNVWQNISFGLIKGKRIKQSLAKEIAIEKLTQVGLKKDIANLYPSELSGGMQKRVALARAIATDPEIIFFDEPTTGLDPIMANVINDLINNIVRKIGATALSITHDIESAKKIADKISMLHEGKIIWTGLSSELEKTNNKHVKQFIHGKTEGPIEINLT